MDKQLKEINEINNFDGDYYLKKLQQIDRLSQKLQRDIFKVVKENQRKIKGRN